MQVKAIRTEQQYEAALERIGELMAADPGTPEFEELDVLTDLVELYETRHHPIDLPDPVEAIKFRMEQAGLSQRDLVPYIGSRAKVSEILGRKRPLTFSMMRKLHAGLDIPAEVFFRDRGPDDDPPAFDARRLPWSDMLMRGWVDFSGSVAEAREHAEELAAAFFEQVPAPCRELAMHRRSFRGRGIVDEYAVTAWTTRVIALACGQEMRERYQPGSVNAPFMAELKRLSTADDGPLRARDFLAGQGIHMIVEPALKRTRVDGAATILPDGTPVVALSLRHDRLDNFWFSLSHELAHVALHLDPQGIDWFVDDFEAPGGEEERQADAWAADGLIPPEVWPDIAAGCQSSEDVVRWARDLSLSAAIIAGRLRFERRDYRRFNDLVGHRRVRVLFGVG